MGVCVCVCGGKRTEQGGTDVMCMGCRYEVGDKKNKDSGRMLGKEGKS
jgi:hypothetical protein